MTVQKTDFEGLYVYKPKVFGDERGSFCEVYNLDVWEGLDIFLPPFVQDNQSVSSKGVLRGLHIQTRSPQFKAVRVSSGSIFDVAVDLRHESPTFGSYFGVELSGENFLQLLIPAGFGHGFLVTSSRAVVQYKVSQYYDPQSEVSIKWDDPELAIKWPSIENLSVSEKDREGLSFAEFKMKVN